ncbi:MAG TPA: glycoside hydrolase family 2 protein [Acidimicrobiales bacterium]|nr:glycoside hydrolase family 2 protein [Acidimicrobiales bacterium]
MIPDPFTGMHERGVQWVDDAAWAYRCTFDVDGAALDGARHVLRFEGLDTIATVLLNDATIGATDNMFVAHEFDVTDAVRAGDNTLEVRFESAERVGQQRLAALADATPAMSSRAMVRKAQYMWGWDWGPRLRGCGVWRPVSLVRVPTARITDWSWRAEFADDGSARVTVDVAVEGDASQIRVWLLGHGTHTNATAPVVDGHAAVTLSVSDPQRWWCAGLGEPHLYDLTISVGDDDDVRDDRIGLRQVELVQEPDAAGASFFFRVNGVPIFAKGANWIPDDSFPARTTPERVRRVLERARDCGMNMIRVWGGGLYESEEFYDACDELGLLVWQDFPFACAVYPDDDATVAAIVPEATAAVKRLRNHTSLALWCGNNENQWLGWMGAYGKLDTLPGLRLYDDVLPAVVAEHDPGRAYWPSSPWGSDDNPSGDSDGDSHYWNVWHGEGDWRHYVKCRARFVSEFGFAAAPAEQTLRGALAPEHLGVDTPAMRWHDKTRKGYETYLGFIALHYPMPATLPELVYYSQLNQADAMRFGIEHFRRMRPHTMGTLVWQLNDCWPVQSWAWVDYALRPKAAWYAAKRFYAPLLLSLTDEDGCVGVHVVNDDVVARDGTVTLRVVDLDGTVLWQWSHDASIDPLASERIADIELPAAVRDAATHALVHATFADVEASLLLAEPKDLVLTAARVTASVDSDAITLTTDRLALSVMLWLDGVDATFSDNFFHLLPGEPRRVTVYPEADLSPDEVAARLRWRTL